jgi:hypothetical protein
MITLIAAAAVAAAQPAGSPANPPMQHPMEMGDHAQHATKENCCCVDMAAKHECQGSEHSEHGAHQQ